MDLGQRARHTLLYPNLAIATAVAVRPIGDVATLAGHRGLCVLGQAACGHDQDRRSIADGDAAKRDIPACEGHGPARCDCAVHSHQVAAVVGNGAAQVTDAEKPIAFNDKTRGCLPGNGQHTAVDRDVGGRRRAWHSAQIGVAADLQGAAIDEGATAIGVAARKHPGACVFFGHVASGGANGTGKAASGCAAQCQVACRSCGRADIGECNGATAAKDAAAGAQKHQSRVGGSTAAVHESATVVEACTVQSQVAGAGDRLAIEVQCRAIRHRHGACAKGCAAAGFQGPGTERRAAGKVAVVAAECQGATTTNRQSDNSAHSIRNGTTFGHRNPWGHDDARGARQGGVGCITGAGEVACHPCCGE